MINFSSFEDLALTRYRLKKDATVRKLFDDKPKKTISPVAQTVEPIFDELINQIHSLNSITLDNCLDTDVDDEIQNQPLTVFEIELKAMNVINDKKYADARKLLIPILQNNARSSYAVELYAKSLIREKYYPQAAKFLAAHLNASENTSWIMGAFCLAYSHVSKKERKKIISLKKIEITHHIIKNTTSFKKLCGIARVLSYQKKYKQAYEIYKLLKIRTGKIRKGILKLDPCLDHCYYKASRHCKRLEKLIG